MDQLAMPVTQQMFRSIIFVEASKHGITLLVVAEQTNDAAEHFLYARL